MKRRLVTAVALSLALLLLASMRYLALAPRSSRPSVSTVREWLQAREGYELRTGKFEGFVPADNRPPTAVTLDGRELQTAHGFEIRRALMRRPLYAFTPRLVLLELPDWQGWSDYSGSDAVYEMSSSGAVSRVVIIERPR